VQEWENNGLVASKSCPRVAALPLWLARNYSSLQYLVLVIHLRFTEDKSELFMAQAVDQVQHDFWRAPMTASAAATGPERSSTCRCGTEYIVSSLFCHACGSRRPDMSASRTLEIPGLAQFVALVQPLGLSKPALVAFLAGILCLVGALAVSAFFTARTLLDWQAIQLWRIEWLLASVAAFVAGCLLKK
jgi:hypothetical protein